MHEYCDYKYLKTIQMSGDNLLHIADLYRKRDRVVLARGEKRRTHGRWVKILIYHYFNVSGLFPSLLVNFGASRHICGGY